MHFDAKYRVNWSTPFETGGAEEEEGSERVGISKRTDLLKMHAYRDAIRDSAGSYVLFPGSETAAFAVNDAEFLPGLGAFPLRPDRAAEDVAALESFLARAFTHVAGAGTRHRRALYWTSRAYAEEGSVAAGAQPPVGALPPADTPVLFGYVRSAEQARWVERTRLYNVRSGGRSGAMRDGSPELDAWLLLLYTRDGALALYRRVGPWEGATAEAMRKLGYPGPRGEAYLLARLERLDAPAWIAEVNVQRLQPVGGLFGEPFSRSWLDLVLSTQVEA